MDIDTNLIYFLYQANVSYYYDRLKCKINRGMLLWIPAWHDIVFQTSPSDLQSRPVSINLDFKTLSLKTHHYRLHIMTILHGITKCLFV